MNVIKGFRFEVLFLKMRAEMTVVLSSLLVNKKVKLAIVIGEFLHLEYKNLIYIKPHLLVIRFNEMHRFSWNFKYDVLSLIE
jgi:hypothetical protein